jgi:hypothetical protein
MLEDDRIFDKKTTELSVLECYHQSKGNVLHNQNQRARADTGFRYTEFRKSIATSLKNVQDLLPLPPFKDSMHAVPVSRFL